MKTSAGLFLTDILPHRRGWYGKIVKNKVFGDLTSSEVFNKLKQAGVDGIELFLPSFSKITHEDFKELKQVLEEHNLPVLSVHQSLRFFSKTKINEITELFSIADMLGAGVVVLHMSNTGKQIFDKAYIEAIHALQKKFGIKVGFENREKFFGSLHMPHSWHHEEFPLLMDKHQFSITLDTTHLATTGENIVDFFRKNKDKIVNIHISDYKPHFLNSTLRPLRFKHMEIGKGTLPLQEFIQTLRKENYNGLVTMEIHTDLDGMCESAKMINRYGKGN
jgi:sugar phosphate isomerase/epimerase